jgi:ubiquinone/menaquinone biosynthesis C-methylase UbiE
MYSKNVYKSFPKLYDLLYQRYLKSVPDFVALVEEHTPRGGLVLDVAAGTGEVTIPLLQKGFRVVSVDSSTGMLKELCLKAKKHKVRNHKTVVMDMRHIEYQRQFDSVCIRQAINYCMGARALTASLNTFYNSLKEGGVFVFNTPQYQGAKQYPTVFHHYTEGKQEALVLETNKIRKRILQHTQHSIIWGGDRKPQFLTDTNAFYMFTKKELEHALYRVGFSKLVWSGSPKTLYCIAIK